MGFGVSNGLKVSAVMVSGEFIDTYMAAANGEYVKVYLYLLRHEADGEGMGISDIADALNHTEADVKRAIAYWEKAGVLRVGERISKETKGGGIRPTEAGSEAVQGEMRAPGAGGQERGFAAGNGRTGEAGALAAGREAAAAALAAPKEMAAAAEDFPKELPAQDNGMERLERLSEDEEFTALLYAVQQYLGKTFSQIECEKFAYFYDGLHMTGELLEYLAEYCAGGGHTSIRYIEKVALNWYQLGITSREDAKDYTIRYSRDVSAVMKAFGITGRNPAAAEQEYMKKWFKEYGFDHKLVSEACGRTIRATGTASFPYADKILSDWKEKGVKALCDVEELDKKRQTETRRKSGGDGGGTPKKAAGTNRFKNFDERANHYEDYVWESIRKRQRKETAGDGTQ